MTKATIPLAQSKFNIGKLDFPVLVSRKFDGVPIRIDVVQEYEGDFSVAVRSRQGKEVKSTDWVVQALIDELMENGLDLSHPTTIIAEVTHTIFTDFKDISGVVRRQEPQPNLVLNIFDFTQFEHTPQAYGDRMAIIADYTDRVVDFEQYLDAEQLEARLAEGYGDWEGLIVRDASDTFEPGSRKSSYQKYVLDPTIELRVLYFEEALSKKDENGVQHPLGMVGRIVARYKGREIGIGPGKLTHQERIDLWTKPFNRGRIAEINTSGTTATTTFANRRSNAGAMTRTSLTHEVPDPRRRD